MENDIILSIQRLLKDRQQPEKEEQERKQSFNVLGFNVFQIVSDIYHRENLHSDILARLLDPNDSHDQRDAFLELFIIHLIELSESRISIDLKNYKSNVKVARENERRDITIYGDNKHAIIIENKINNAADTYNQIPTYYNQLAGEGKDVEEKWTVDAIVYLTLNQSKSPDKSTWNVTPREFEVIENLIVPFRAYEDGKTDLCAWLEKCQSKIKTPKIDFFLSDYTELIKYLSKNLMNQEFYEKFNDSLKENKELCDTAISLKETLAGYSQFVLSKLSSYYSVTEKCRPFKGFKVYYFYDYQIAGYTFNADVKISDILTELTIDFSVRGKQIWMQKYPKAVLETIEFEHQFEWRGDRYYHSINCKFVDFEDEAIKFIDRFFNALRINETQIKAALDKIN